MKAGLLAVLLLSACGAASAVSARFTDRPTTAAELRATWGEPCAVEQLSAGEERWTYCVTVEDGHEFWATCRPNCEPAHRMLLSHRLIIADEPPSP